MTIKRRDLHNIFQKFSGWRHFYAFEHQKPGFIDILYLLFYKKLQNFLNRLIFIILFTSYFIETY